MEIAEIIYKLYYLDSKINPEIPFLKQSTKNNAPPTSIGTSNSLIASIYLCIVSKKGPYQSTVG